MKNLLAFFLVIGISSTLYSQEKSKIIRVIGRYAVINKGSNDGIKEGDKFKVFTNKEHEYGEIEVIKSKQTISAVKLLKSTSGYVLKVGDIFILSNEEIVDELLYETPKQVSEQHKIKQKGQRKGFIIGGGIGGGFLSNKASVGSSSNTESEAIFLTEFKIGYAPSNTLEIYYISKGSWWGDDIGMDVIFFIGLSAVGVTKYLNHTSETGIFVTGGLGLTILDAPFEDNVDSSTGFGLFGGLGYEFSKHWSVEADVLYSHITELGVDFDSLGFRVSFNVLAF